MKILWINCATAESFSHTELIEIPKVLQKMGDQVLVVVAGKSSLKTAPHFLFLPSPFGSFSVYRFLLALVLPFLCFKYKPDILLTDWMSSSLTRLVVLAKSLGLLRCGLVHDVRTIPVKEDGGRSLRIFSKSLNYARRRFDGITTITERLRDQICQEFGLIPDRIAVWTSGVDVNHFQPVADEILRARLGLEGKFVVFYHGAVGINRGVMELAESVCYLRDIPELCLLIVGGGNQWDELQEMVEQKQLNQVILQSSVSYSEIPQWIAVADLCVVPLPDHPWWRVSSPLKLMEYLAMGKPILLTEMAAHRAVIPDDADAFYVPSAKPDVLAGGIRCAFAERHRLKEMGQKGRRKAKAELTWEEQARVLRDYLESVMEEGTKPSQGTAWLT